MPWFGGVRGEVRAGQGWDRGQQHWRILLSCGSTAFLNTPLELEGEKCITLSNSKSGVSCTGKGPVDTRKLFMNHKVAANLEYSRLSRKTGSERNDDQTLLKDEFSVTIPISIIAGWPPHTHTHIPSHPHTHIYKRSTFLSFFYQFSLLRACTYL